MEIKYLEVVVMPNGEILCCGKSLGWKDADLGEDDFGVFEDGRLSLGRFLNSKEEIQNS